MAATSLSHSSPLTHPIHWTHICSIEAYRNTANKYNRKEASQRPLLFLKHGSIAIQDRLPRKEVETDDRSRTLLAVFPQASMEQM